MVTDTHLEVLFTPNEFCALTPGRLRDSVCVVFDVLRATTSMVTALAYGAKAIQPVTTIADAVQFRQAHPGALLGGEREGWRITAEVSGGTDFDFGNSPAEFTTSRIRDRLVAMTTTNGTRALHAARPAPHTFVGSFLNLQATVDALRALSPQSLLIIGAGTYEEAALEDTLAAGALCDSLWDLYQAGAVADSARIARLLFQQLGQDLPHALSLSRNGTRLLQTPAQRDDVAFAAQTNIFPVVTQLDQEGLVRQAG